MHAAVPALRYVQVGGVLEPDLARDADAWFAARPWALRLGAVGRDAALRALAAADASFHASVVEGLSNALLESMALGTVPVARDIPASRAAVTDGADGLLSEMTAGVRRGGLLVLTAPVEADRDGAGSIEALRRLVSGWDLLRFAVAWNVGPGGWRMGNPEAPLAREGLALVSARAKQG